MIGKWVIPLKKQLIMAETTRSLHLASQVTCRRMESFLGLLFAYQIQPSLRLFAILLIKPQLLSDAYNRDKKVTLFLHFKDALKPWLHDSIFSAPVYFKPPYSRLTIWTDASMVGWGVFKSDNSSVQGYGWIRSDICI